MPTFYAFHGAIRFYSFASKMQAPDEMGFSVLNPDYEGIQRVARPAFAAGTALGITPMMRGMNLAPRPAVRAPSAESQAGMIVIDSLQLIVIILTYQ